MNCRFETDYNFIMTMESPDLMRNNNNGTRFDFSGIASVYDQWYETRTGRAYDIAEKRAVSKLLPNPGVDLKLLEIGCGTGHWSEWLASSGFKVTGIDISPEMVNVARSKNIGSAVFEHADAHTLPFRDGDFDVTAAITSLEFAGSAETVLRDMARCTKKPGGVIIIGVLNALAPLNAERKANGEPPYSQARLFSPEEVRDILSLFGEPEIIVTAFLPRHELLIPLAPLFDVAGRIFHRNRGAFIAGKVVL